MILLTLGVWFLVFFQIKSHKIFMGTCTKRVPTVRGVDVYNPSGRPLRVEIVK